MRSISSIQVLLLAALSLLAAGGAEALPPQEWSPTQAPSLQPGTYCGGEPMHTRGLTIDLNAECKASLGPNASAVAVGRDAYGWVCRAPGQPDQGLDLQAACQRLHGPEAIVTLVGIGLNDWRCLRPSDVSGHVVPILLVPVEKLSAAEIPFVQAALRRVETLLGGVRHFYRERTSAAVPGTNAFVLLTSTSASDWQNLALATDHPSGGFPLDRYGYQNRIKQELDSGRWNVLLERSTVRIGGFVTLGSSPGQTPTWLGAASDPEGHYFSAPPVNSYAGCSPRQLNPPRYENAFYASAHEFGHLMGLPHTEEYPFDNHLLKPADYQNSIMQLGNGTQSLLFPFEACRALDFLTNWR